jgi:hypothetical protein
MWTLNKSILFLVLCFYNAAPTFAIVLTF